MSSERGSTLVLASVSLVGLMFITALGLDTGLVLVAKSQAQTSADAGAQAGATALAFHEDAVPAALTMSRENLVLKKIPSVDVELSCVVTLDPGPCVTVDVTQDVESSLFRRVFHVHAKAEAQVRTDVTGKSRVVLIR